MVFTSDGRVEESWFLRHQTKLLSEVRHVDISEVFVVEKLENKRLKTVLLISRDRTNKWM